MELSFSRLYKLILLSFFLVSFKVYGNIKVQPVELKCEHMIRPIGIDDIQPRLSWIMKDNREGAKQTAYRIIIGKDSMEILKNNGKYWDTGKVKSSTSLTSYKGKLLEPFTKYYWLIEVWDKDGKKGSMSEVSTFETGMMNMKNWKGTWISDKNDIDILPAAYFRKVFDTPKKVKSARAYIAVGGLYELYLNGKKVGNHRLDPMFTRFDRRNLYVSYDVTSHLKNGRNAIGVILGNGWYNHQALAVWNFDKAPWRARPTFCLDLRITYDDGTIETLITDRSWKTSTGPIIRNNIYTGEHYDSRLEQIGWNLAQFDDSKWREITLRAAPSKNIVSQVMHPIRNVAEIPVKSLKKINDTIYIFDLGRNIAGVTKIRVKGENVL